MHMDVHKKNNIRRVILITPTSSQPRYHKRVAQLTKFCEVMVFSFNRGYYNENTFPANVPYISLGRIEDGKYFNRIFRVAASILKVRSYLNADTKYLFYAMSFDCMLIARLCGLRNGFYEIGDLRQAEGLGKALSFLERIFFKKISGLVLTSQHFYTDFYKQRLLLPEQRIFVIDNKVNRLLADKRPCQKRLTGRRVKIGLVGLLRYKRPIELLLNFVKKRPESYIIECFGDGPLKTLVESYRCENIRYHGSFKNPDDVPGIYEQIDLNYVVYDSSTRNVRLAIPNKIFESAFFGVPIVCCEGTAVGRMAMEWQIGKTVRISDETDFETDFNSIDKVWLHKCTKNCFKLPDDKLLDIGDHVICKMLSDTVHSISA